MTDQTPPSPATAQQAPEAAPEPLSTPLPAALPDQADMTPRQLAEAILAREVTRPRISSVRRLAEALLAKGKKKKKKTGKSGGKAEKKVRKLALIPGQKNSGQKAR